MLITHKTKSFKETQKLGEDFAKKVLKIQNNRGAVILVLKGNLGGGKTTFLQGFGKGLGVEDKILSPTFVILKHFKGLKSNFENFYHIDCYRLKNEKDIIELDFQSIISNPKNIVAVEWPEKIKKVIPKDAIKINFKFLDENRREIKFHPVK